MLYLNPQRRHYRILLLAIHLFPRALLSAEAFVLKDKMSTVTNKMLPPAIHETKLCHPVWKLRHSKFERNLEHDQPHFTNSEGARTFTWGRSSRRHITMDFLTYPSTGEFIKNILLFSFEGRSFNIKCKTTQECSTH